MFLNMGLQARVVACRLMFELRLKAFFHVDDKMVIAKPSPDRRALRDLQPDLLPLQFFNILRYTGDQSDFEPVKADIIALQSYDKSGELNQFLIYLFNLSNIRYTVPQNNCPSFIILNKIIKLA
jgi:hypothetical protein